MENQCHESVDGRLNSFVQRVTILLASSRKTHTWMIRVLRTRRAGAARVSPVVASRDAGRLAGDHNDFHHETTRDSTRIVLPRSDSEMRCAGPAVPTPAHT